MVVYGRWSTDHLHSHRFQPHQPCSSSIIWQEVISKWPISTSRIRLSCSLKCPAMVTWVARLLLRSKSVEIFIQRSEPIVEVQYHFQFYTCQVTFVFLFDYIILLV